MSRDPESRGSGAPGPPDREVLEGVRRHDPAALQAFFERYVDGIHDLAYRMLGERAAAEDVTQEVFLRVHRFAPRLDPGRDPEPWLAKVTRNACRDVWRSAAYRHGRRSLPLDTDPEQGGVELPSPGDDPETTAVKAERDRAVQEAVLDLPPEQREVVVLHDYRGYRHDEIAEMVGASHSAIRKRYSRALARLAAKLRRILE